MSHLYSARKHGYKIPAKFDAVRDFVQMIRIDPERASPSKTPTQKTKTNCRDQTRRRPRRNQKRNAEIRLVGGLAGTRNNAGISAVYGISAASQLGAEGLRRELDGDASAVEAN